MSTSKRNEWYWLTLLNLPDVDIVMKLTKFLYLAEELGLDLEKIQQIVETKYKPEESAEELNR